MPFLVVPHRAPLPRLLCRGGHGRARNVLTAAAVAATAVLLLLLPQSWQYGRTVQPRLWRHGEVFEKAL